MAQIVNGYVATQAVRKHCIVAQAVRNKMICTKSNLRNPADSLTVDQKFDLSPVRLAKEYAKWPGSAEYFLNRNNVLKL